MRRSNRTLRQRLSELMDKMEPVFQAAFRESVQAIVSEVRISAIVERLERGDVEGAIRMLHIEEAAFTALHGAVLEAFNQGGATTIANMPKLRDRGGSEVVVRWNVRDLPAERRIAELSSTLITGITEETRDLARNLMQRGMSEGAHPRKMALDLTGRKNAVGVREGGAIGLSSVQEEWTATAERELLSGDPDQMRNYLARRQRNKGPGGVFDRRVREAIETKRPVPVELVTKMRAGYVSNLLRLRGETIARTETLESVSASKMEAFRQGLGKTGYTEAAVKRTWRDSGLPNTRHSHLAMDGQVVHGLTEPFVSPVTGARLLHPGDRTLGAPAREIINCRCDADFDILYGSE